MSERHINTYKKQKTSHPSVMNKCKRNENCSFAFVYYNLRRESIWRVCKTSGMETITILGPVTSIDDYVSHDCRSLVLLPCHTLTRSYDIVYSNIALPDSIVPIESDAFYCCNVPEQIEIPKSVCGLVKKHLCIAFICCLIQEDLEYPDASFSYQTHSSLI